MAADQDKPGNKPPQGPRDGGARDGVRHDARGNAVWQWAIDTGKHTIDSTSRLLKRLEVPGLSLEDDARKSDAKRASSSVAGAAAGAAAGSARSTTGPERATGYDPYGTRAGGKGSAVRPAVRPAAAVRTPAAAPPARPSFWRRLFRRG
jgi:hypothetical protein